MRLLRLWWRGWDEVEKAGMEVEGVGPFVCLRESFAIAACLEVLECE